MSLKKVAFFMAITLILTCASFPALAEETEHTVVLSPNANGTLTLPEETPEKDGYVFKGWYTQSGEPYVNGTQVSGETTLVAEFVEVIGGLNAEVNPSGESESCDEGKNTIPAETFYTNGLYIQGAQVRLPVTDTEITQGLRFVVALNNNLLTLLEENFTNVEYGSLLATEEFFEGENFDVSNNLVRKFSSKKQYRTTQDTAKDYFKYTFCITDIPTDNFVTNIFIRPYICYTDKSGVTRYLYGETEKDFSLRRTAKLAIESGNENADAVKYLEDEVINKMKKPLKNLLDTTDFPNNIYIEWNGVETEYSGWSATDYIPVEYGDTYFCMALNDGEYVDVPACWGAYYDIDKNVISRILGKLNEHPVPSNAKYMRISRETKDFIQYGANPVPKTIVSSTYAWETLPEDAGDYISYEDALLEKDEPETPPTIKKNLLDKSAIVRDIWINGGGAESAYAGWSATDYIPVVPGESYFFKMLSDGVYTEVGTVWGAFYAEDYSVVGTFTGELNKQTVPADAAYVRLSQETRKFVQDGANPNPKAIVSALSAWDNTPPTDADDYVAFESSSTEEPLPDTRTNYLDINALTIGSYLDKGELVAYANWVASDFIPVEEGKTYFFMYLNDGEYVDVPGCWGAYYDADKKYIAGSGAVISANPAPAGAKWLRVSNQGRYFTGTSPNPKSIISSLDDWGGKIPTVESDYVKFTRPDGIPSYLEPEVAEVAGKLNALQNDNTLTFAFMTDMHNSVGSTAELPNQNAIFSVGEVNKKAPVDYLVFGGDYTSNNQYTETETCKDQIESLSKVAAKLSVNSFFIRGNHDSNPFNKSAPFTEKMYHDASNAIVNNGNIVRFKDSDDGVNSAGYVDFEQQKIRFIFTNMTDVGDQPAGFGITGEQIEWFGDVALNFSNKDDASEWAVVVFAHTYFVDSNCSDNSGLTVCSQMHNTLKAFRDGTSWKWSDSKTFDFSAQGKMQVLGAFVGHWHGDRTDVVDDIRIIETMNTTNAGGNEPSDDQVTYQKIYGTVDECGYDYVTIDREKGKMYLTRFGIGNDREFNIPSFTFSKALDNDVELDYETK